MNTHVRSFLLSLHVRSLVLIMILTTSVSGCLISFMKHGCYGNSMLNLRHLWYWSRQLLSWRIDKYYQDTLIYSSTNPEFHCLKHFVLLFHSFHAIEILVEGLKTTSHPSISHGQNFINSLCLNKKVLTNQLSLFTVIINNDCKSSLTLIKPSKISADDTLIIFTFIF